jgi:unsaturated chondroitin disaccharide hydrolase
MHRSTVGVTTCYISMMADIDYGISIRPALDYAVGKLRQMAPEVASFPQETVYERWAYRDDGGWVGGFWPGQLWLAWLDTGEPEFRQWAEAAAGWLAPRQDDTSTHDLGFLFYPSWVMAWRLTGQEPWRDGAVRAAGSLLRRFHERGRFIRAWGALDTADRAGRAIIDTMMNLDLLMWASAVTGRPDYADAAVAHAETTARLLVRADGSTSHAYDFDPVTGEPVGPGTHQGHSPASCWSRGQSWAVYGFTAMHQHTGAPGFLATAQAAADYVVAHLPEDGVPFWDYRSPYLPYDVRDSSAGAIAACGLLDLAAATGHDGYRRTAATILSGLLDTCLTTRSDRAEGILTRGTRNRPHGRGIEVCLPYGDYYFMEALLRILRPDELSRATGRP